MDSTPDTFDTDINLPSSISLSKFAHARCKEIQVMQKFLSSSEYSTKLAFQKLPRHMRRRAMSHNVKRLPRRLREKHMNQMKKSGLPPKQKRPSRKYRRKPTNLLEEYTRRKSKIKWLNTHIWHAKRFHMITKWGYKLPFSLCDKAFKACYRASKNRCLLQDISFFQCIELTARKEHIIDKFEKITNPSDGLSVGSRVYGSGIREGETTIYELNSNVKQALGKIKFSWKFSLVAGEMSTLWIWSHIAFYKDILQTLLECFDLERIDIDHYCDSEKTVHLKEFRTQLSRFRLSGVLSNSVVQNCFTLSNCQRIVEEWYENDEIALKVVEEQQSYWKDLKSISSLGNLSPNVCVSVVVSDPRLSAPIVRKRSIPEENSYFEENCSIPEFNLSPLWDEKLLKIINSSRISDSEVSKIRSQCLIPGSNLSEMGYPVPLILVQRSGSRDENLGYSAGWDLILPSSWAQPIWISLIMWGARGCGLREYSHNNFEMGKPDLLFPDTPAGKREEEDMSENSIKAFFRRPPNKRSNFNKFKIVSPFRFNWKMLIEDWLQKSIDTFVVLRDRKVLLNLQQSLLSGEDVSLPDNCLVPVKIKCEKHVPKPFSIICFPYPEDFKNTPKESKSPDQNQKKRAELRKQHKILLKRLQYKRKNAKRLQEKLKNINLPELIAYHTEMRKLWLPPAENIKNSCMREILGFVKEGGFSYTLGVSKGLGYVSGAALRILIRKDTKSRVLIRNTNSRNYFFGRLSIITDL